MQAHVAITFMAPQSEWPQMTMSVTPSPATAYSTVAVKPPGSGPRRNDVAGITDDEQVARFTLRHEFGHEPAV
ncbi:hypothetical protein AWB70_04275 [Caballeronia cordobensis]|uniref:Uncharacterized protein n=1 Tax=Caballeronia cordobensis TaxID=1353886 RepID=A0A158I785_CABCO|nr:hypothetical protein AWB70_04275 [Caballeronia cordobensis]